METRLEDLPFQAHLVVSQCETYTHSLRKLWLLPQGYSFDCDFTVESQR